MLLAGHSLFIIHYSVFRKLLPVGVVSVLWPMDIS